MYDFSDTSALANASEESIDSLSQAIDVLLRHMNTSQTSGVTLLVQARCRYVGGNDTS